MRPLAVTGTKRHPLLPDVPTFEELGYKGFDGVQWYGIVGPANMPPAIVADAQQGDQRRARRSRSCSERLSGEALEPMPMTPDAVRPVHARRHREVDEGREGTQHRDHGRAGGSSGSTAPALCSARAMIVTPQRPERTRDRSRAADAPTAHPDPVRRVRASLRAQRHWSEGSRRMSSR